MVHVDLITDFSCPFSWLAEAAMRRLRDEGLVTLEYRALELFPAPEALGEVPGVEAAGPLAAELGLELRPPTRAVRTRKAHELARIARAHGREDAVREATYAAYLNADRDIGRIDVLTGIGTAAGLDTGEVRVVLDIDTHSAAVAAETAAARKAGIEATPVVILDGRVRVDGTFPLDEWRGVLERVEATTRDQG